MGRRAVIFGSAAAGALELEGGNGLPCYSAPVSRVMLVKEATTLVPPTIHGPQSVAAALWPLVELFPVEMVFAVAVDARRKVLQVVRVSEGCLTSSIVHPREFFRVALLSNAAGLIAVHNHPSGECQPSPEDHALTRRLREAAEIMGIPLMDHLILGKRDSFFSYAEHAWPQ
jgi:DNA repair protein RadC